MTKLRQLTDCLKDRLARRVGVWTGVAFVLLYLYSVRNIVIAPGVDLVFGTSLPSAVVISDWPAKMWKSVAPFVWEPIAALYLTRAVALFISPLNLLLALVLGILVALNMAVALARARLMAVTKEGSGFMGGFLASLPALLTGFTCCVPTVILALGSAAAAFSVAAIAVAPYFLPLAVVALIANLLWNLRQFSCAIPGGL